jgi:hypothetical protein
MVAARAWFGLLLAACGPERLSPVEECPPPEEAARVSWNHACEHLRTGRAEPLDARARTPEIRNTHIVYRVLLRESATGYRGEVSFNPRVSSPFVFYTSEGGALNVSEQGARRCRAGSSTSTMCDLRLAEVYELVESPPVTLELGPASAEAVLLMAEIP